MVYGRYDAVAHPSGTESGGNPRYHPLGYPAHAGVIEILPCIMVEKTRQRLRNAIIISQLASDLNVVLHKEVLMNRIRSMEDLEKAKAEALQKEHEDAQKNRFQIHVSLASCGIAAGAAKL